MAMEINQVYQMDAIDLLYSLEKHSADAIISDFPYGTTSASWDVMPDLPKLWDAIKHALKPSGVVVTTASQPFTSMLVMSNLDGFTYSWVWVKNTITGHGNAKRQPLKQYEDICVFYANGYNPQGLTRINRVMKNSRSTGGETTGAFRYGETYTQEFENYPRNVLYFDAVVDTEHPTQKPVALYEYLILTYTQSGALVVDPYCGSGTTCIAARNTGRHFIGGDLSPDYVAIAQRRLAQDYTLPMFTD